MTKEELDIKCQALNLLVEKNILTKDEYDKLVECLEDNFSDDEEETNEEFDEDNPGPLNVKFKEMADMGEYSICLSSIDFDDLYSEIKIYIQNNTDNIISMNDLDISINGIMLPSSVSMYRDIPAGRKALIKENIDTDNLKEIEVYSENDIREVVFSNITFDMGDDSYTSIRDIVINK